MGILLFVLQAWLEEKRFGKTNKAFDLMKEKMDITEAEREANKEVTVLAFFFGGIFSDFPNV